MANTTPKKEVAEKDPVVTVEMLQEILANQKEQGNVIEAQRKEIERLTAVASKARLDVYDSKTNSDELIKTVNIRKWDGEIILGWKMFKDNVGVVEGRLIEEQILKLFIENGTDTPKEIEVGYLDFARNVEFEKAEVIKESKMKNAEIFTVQLADGRTFDFDIKFVN